MLKYSLFLALLIVHIHAYGSDSSCDKFQINKNFNSAVSTGVVKFGNDQRSNLGPTRDQDGTGYCYGYAGADLYEQFLRRKGHISGDENIISAMGMSLQYSSKLFKDRIPTFNAYVKSINAVDRSGKLRPIRDRYFDLLSDHKKLVENIEIDMSSRPKFNKWDDLEADYELALATSGIPRAYFEDDNSDQEVAICFDKSSWINENLHSNNSCSAAAYQTQEAYNRYEKKTDEFIDSYFRNPETRNNEMLNLYARSEQAKEELLKMMSDIKQSGTIDNYDLLPSGGNAEDALNSVWPNICLENEINSSSDQTQDLLTKIVTASAGPTNSTTTIMASSELSGPGSIFPGAKLDAIESNELMKKVKQEKGNIISEMLERSCSKKSSVKYPKPTVKKISAKGGRSIPITTNGPVFDFIDEQLKNGGVVSIGYRAQILDSNTLDENNKDSHASLIVGDADICGEKYYILRNSWGKESCSTRNSFDNRYEKVSAEEANNSAKNHKTCIKAAELKYHGEDKEEKLDNANNSCYQTYEREIYKASPALFFCDNDGNFIISKKRLSTGLYDATAITN